MMMTHNDENTPYLDVTKEETSVSVQVRMKMVGAAMRADDGTDHASSTVCR